MKFIKFFVSEVRVVVIAIYVDEKIKGVHLLCVTTFIRKGLNLLLRDLI